jgi:hypothetical protein
MSGTLGLRTLSLALLAAAGMLFSNGCDGTESMGPPQQDPKAMNVEALGLSLTVAPGWTGHREDSSPLYLTVTRDGFTGFQPSLNVVAGDFPGSPDMESIVQALADAKQAEPGSDAIIISQGTEPLGGMESGRLDYQFTANGQELRARQYAVRHRGLLILITCMDGFDAFRDREAEFDAMLATLKLR